MADTEKLSYQGLAIGLLLAAQSGLQGDLAKLEESGNLNADTCRQLLRHAVYHETSAFGSGGGFNPQEPAEPDPDIELALSLVNFDEMAEGFSQFMAAGEAIQATVGNLLTYEGGSCPISAQQPYLYAALKQFGADLKPKSFKMQGGVS